MVNNKQIAKTNDVPSLIVLLENELKSIKEVTESNYRTSGILEGVGDIKIMTDLSSLVKAYASVIVREKAYFDATNELGLDEVPAFVLSGGSKNDWKEDISLRIKIITHETRKKELEALISEVRGFLSVEDQKALTMAKIEKLLVK
jgi:hypothetical protein